MVTIDWKPLIKSVLEQEECPKEIFEEMTNYVMWVITHVHKLNPTQAVYSMKTAIQKACLLKVAKDDGATVVRWDALSFKRRHNIPETIAFHKRMLQKRQDLFGDEMGYYEREILQKKK